MKILWLFWASSDRLDFWGAIIGGVAGALGAYLAAVFTIQGTKKLEKSRHEQEQMLEHRRALMTAGIILQEHVILLNKNVHTLNKCIDLISKPGLIAKLPRSSLPRAAPFKTDIMRDFHNAELANHWLKLNMTLKNIYDMTDDFRSYYQRSTKALYSILMQPSPNGRPEMPNLDIVNHDTGVVVNFGKDLISATRLAIDETLAVLALAEAYAKLPRSKFKSISQLLEFSCPLTDYEAELQDAHNRFAPENLFKRVG